MTITRAAIAGVVGILLAFASPAFAGSIPEPGTVKTSSAGIDCGSPAGVVAIHELIMAMAPMTRIEFYAELNKMIVANDLNCRIAGPERFLVGKVAQTFVDAEGTLRAVLGIYLQDGTARYTWVTADAEDS